MWLTKFNVNLFFFFSSIPPTRHEFQTDPGKPRGQAHVIDIYPYLLPGRIWHKVFFKVGIRGRGGRTLMEIHVLMIIGSSSNRASASGSLPVIDSLRAKWIFSMLVNDSPSQKANCNVNLWLTFFPPTRHECQEFPGKRRELAHVINPAMCVIYQ